MSLAPPEYLVEILEEQPTTITEVEGGGAEFLVEISNSTVIGEPAVPEIIEVAIVPPTGSGIRQIETVPFTKQGLLTTVPSNTEFPIGPGAYTVASISARCGTAPVGQDVILHFKKNDVLQTVITIPAGSQNATVGDYSSVMLAEGDYIEVIIQQIGTTFPGENLVVSIRLERVG